MSNRPSTSTGSNTFVKTRVKSSASCGTRIAQTAAVTIVFVALAGGFCYAILNHESGEAGKHESETIQNVSNKFSLFWNQYSEYGWCRLILPQNRTFQKDSKALNGFETYWYQDNDNQRIIYKVDKTYVAFVFRKYTYWANYDAFSNLVTCELDQTLGYEEFIRRLGLYTMINRHSEIRQIGRGQVVYVYDGESNSIPLRSGSDIARHVRAYANKQNGAFAGFDTFYGKNSKANIAARECFFANMISKKPPAGTWEKMIPAECTV